jgi:hypothetical protein
MNGQFMKTLNELESIIVNLGYSQNTAAMVLAFLKSQEAEVSLQQELKTSHEELRQFLNSTLKPIYLAPSIDHNLALVDISVERQDKSFYFTKHLFSPQREQSLLMLHYARMTRVKPDCYDIAVVEDNGHRIVYEQLSFQECLNVLATDPQFAP